MVCGLPLTEEQLVEPGREPNPQLLKLANIMSDLYRLGMDSENMALRAEFLSAYNHVVYAFQDVCKAKNIMAGEA